VKTSLNPNDGLKKVGNVDQPWLEGHFGTVFVDEIFVSHPEGGGRRVMLEGDAISYEDLVDKPVLLQGERGEQGISADAPGYIPSKPLSFAL
jgi:hypothetical protein